MNTQLIVVIVILLVIVIAFYVVSTIMRKKNQERLEELEDRREALLDLPVEDEIDEVKKMHLVGQSQNTFREWNQKWTDISKSSIGDLETQIYEIENENDLFRFMKAKHSLDTAEAQMGYMEGEVDSIREGLRSLRESEERNSLAVQEALDVYEDLKTRLNEEKASYGAAAPEMEKHLVNIEIEFTQFVTLNTTGDPVEARKVLNQAEEDTFELKNKMDRIPPLVLELTDTFPSQVEELEKGHQQLLEQKYIFAEKDIEARLFHIKGQIEDSKKSLEQTDLDMVEEVNRNIDEEVNFIYDIFEREIDSHKYVKANTAQVMNYIEHAKKNNRQLLIELDHTSQSYTLNHNELGRARGYQTEIDTLERNYKLMLPKLEEKQMVYSQAREFYEDSYKVLDDIESEQLQILSDVKELRKGEKEAQKKVDDFEFKLRNIKRYVEKQRLPGLPADYLEFFFVASDRVEELAGELNKIRINMDEIEKLSKFSSDDIEILQEKTDELIDSAALAEQMMQYANRYRHNNPMIAQAIDHSLQLFTKEYRYKDALDEIGSSLNKVEPGAFERIEKFYFSHRELA
ncbi:septation ring formation regulator [Pilibacter termitis]|uniref:Septation ring formation regulator EzrA n=1 Tax=Pilibacter termitis TaxID=263852 RepID=A0A1T4QQ54_9ENTE|nr:septation ring formation regulator EzrA [Pilibacter termitis]SKA05880.1 septation ring formation regulator [Pilibacter termitis]